MSTIDTTYTARIDAIRDGAVVRQHLGQTAHHHFVDGQHHVAIFDRTAGVLREGSSATIQAAIAAIQEQERQT